MYNVSIFKQRVKELCSQNGITQKHVSESTFHGQYFLNDVWQGKRTMSDSDFALVANTLRTSPAYLKGETDDPSIPDADMERHKRYDRLMGINREYASAFPDERIFLEIIKEQPKKLEIMKRLAGLDVDTLLKVEQIIDMIKGDTP